MPNHPHIAPNTAMVFAAGLGKRMRPLTDHLPKPMIEVAGTSMLARALDGVEASGIKRAVVNTHYKAEHIERYIAARNMKNSPLEIVISHEKEQLLETGGGIVHAKETLGNEPIFTINGDIIWQDGRTPALTRLAECWNPDMMDMLLLLQPRETAIGYDGKGDFDITPNNQLCKPESDTQPYVFTGIQILKPSLLYTYDEEPFSLNVLYHKAKQPDHTYQRIYGLVHDGSWFHIGTPNAIAEVETMLKRS